MVSDVVQLENSVTAKHPDNNDDDECDDVSVVSSTESRVECDGAVVLNNAQDKSPSFQNIEVTNSSDVHFGNKTYYQGPVTIKQILYSNPAQNGNDNDSQKLPISDTCGKDNDGYVTDSANPNGVIKNGNIVNNNHSNNINWTAKPKGNKWLRSRTKKQLIIGTITTMLIVLCIAAIIVALLVTKSNKEEVSSTATLVEHEINRPNNDPEGIGNVAIVSRLEWVAEPAEKTSLLKEPIPDVIITETQTKTCGQKGQCVFLVRHLQTQHKESLSFWDIKYNFLVGGDGNIYEGRGWSNQGSSVSDCNKNSIGISFIGTFSQTAPSPQQVNAARRLIGMGIRLGHISTNYKVISSSQILGPGIGSGKKLDESVKSWPHWSNVNYFHDNAAKQELCN